MKRLMLATIALFGFSFVSTLSAQNADYFSHDLLVEDLKGNVAKVEYIEEYGVTTKSYDAKGRLIPNGLTIKRDSQNRIVSIEDLTDPVGYGEYYFYHDNGWLAEKKFWGGDAEGADAYYYSVDSDGNMYLSFVSQGLISGDGEYHTSISYAIIERDHKGNWIKRRAEYETKYETVIPDSNRTYTNTVVETRRITYR